VKTSRFSKNVSFVHFFDGSTTQTVQVVLGPDDAIAFKGALGVGTAVCVSGTWVESPGGKQDVEVAATEIVIVGESDASTYPIQKGKKRAIGFDTLRTMAHFRPRTNTFQSVFRVRNALAWQVHRYFQERGFLWIHTPIISTSDCEGAGELFEVRAGDKADGFFGTPAYLTVSGQLQVECFAQSHTDVYTFGPTFRAENSNTSRHAAEFWMIEPEIAFADIDDVIALAEDFVRTVTRATLEQCAEDFEFFDKRIHKGLLAELEACISKPFARVTHAQANEILVASGRAFEYPVLRHGLPERAEGVLHAPE
jgi:asparaginyl-tRNA synthetase